MQSFYPADMKIWYKKLIHLNYVYIKFTSCFQLLWSIFLQDKLHQVQSNGSNGWKDFNGSIGSKGSKSQMAKKVQMAQKIHYNIRISRELSIFSFEISSYGQYPWNFMPSDQIESETSCINSIPISAIHIHLSVTHQYFFARV